MLLSESSLFSQNTFKCPSSRDSLILVGSPLDGNFKKVLNEVIEFWTKGIASSLLKEEFPLPNYFKAC